MELIVLSAVKITALYTWLHCTTLTSSLLHSDLWWFPCVWHWLRDSRTRRSCRCSAGSSVSPTLRQPKHSAPLLPSIRPESAVLLQKYNMSKVKRKVLSSDTGFNFRVRYRLNILWMHFTWGGNPVMLFGRAACAV